MTVAAARFVIASALLWLWVQARGPRERRIVAADLPLILAMGLTAIAGFSILLFYGLTLAPATDAALLTPGASPILTALLAWGLFGERMRRRGVAGLAIGVAGLVLIVSPGGGTTPARLLGDLLFVLGSSMWAVFSIIGRAATRRFTPLVATLYGSVAGTIMLVPLAFVERGWTSLAVSPPVAWLGLVYLAVFATALGFVFFYEGVSRVGAVRATSFALLIPVFGVISSVLILGERLTGKTVAGGALVLLGLWMVQSAAKGSDSCRLAGVHVSAVK